MESLCCPANCRVINARLICIDKRCELVNPLFRSLSVLGLCPERCQGALAFRISRANNWTLTELHWGRSMLLPSRSSEETAIALALMCDRVSVVGGTPSVGSARPVLACDPAPRFWRTEGSDRIVGAHSNPAPPQCILGRRHISEAAGVNALASICTLGSRKLRCTYARSGLTCFPRA
ncbi:hypothetical protein DAEQUDRAFT_353975 [Daedalea quercina L-15889]|uniref:Uncharacterized protein n=1 Tax=Daedalea quercina L-15889 TaxID=1314783 RepID=A0A165TQ72_9APHY|nr:hypothetical protein DAEQUDRAFT_353975 [Daedalea quercina L-15889]